LRRFAESNGWNTGGIVPPNPVLKDLGFWFGRALIQGKLDGQPFWLHAVNSPGKLSDFDVISVEATKELPTLFILPNLGQFDGFMDEVGKKANLVPLQLDEAFGNKVVVYGAQGQESEAQKLLKVIQTVVVSPSIKAVLFVGKNIYISPKDFQDPKQLRALFENAQNTLLSLK
jgi:hypothetical protein